MIDNQLDWVLKNQDYIMGKNNQDEIQEMNEMMDNHDEIPDEDNGLNPKKVQNIIMPMSISDCRRHLNKLAIDALHAANTYGPTTDFLTLTTSIHWREIQEKLLEGQSAFERPDVILQVFREKLKQIIYNLKFVV
jgi:hypothetical protein